MILSYNFDKYILAWNEIEISMLATKLLIKIYDNRIITHLTEIVYYKKITALYLLELSHIKMCVCRLYGDVTKLWLKRGS